MDMPALQIGPWKFLVPIVQGGMGVRVSGWQLVLPVAQEECVGTLTTIGLANLWYGMRYVDFNRTSCEAVERDILQLRSLTDKPFAVNVMGALSNANDLIIAAVKAGANIIVYGAGIPLTLPLIVQDPAVALVPIISSARLAKLILKRWERYNRTPDAFIIEGPLAGGHLGFTFEQLAHIDDFSLESILKETLEVIKPFEDSCGRKIPLITAGGIYTGNDIARMLSLGASGVQMGTRFVATTECPMAEEFKQLYVRACAEDIQIVESPVGMPGRVLTNPFLRQLQSGNIPKPHCPFHCILSCQKDKAGFCIADRLTNSFRGDVDNGLIFCGANVDRIDKIVSVHDLIEELIAEVKASPLTLP